MQILIPEWGQAINGIGAISTLRAGGMSGKPYDDGCGGGGMNLGAHVGDSEQAVRHNRNLLRAMLPDEPVWLAQVHGSTVIDAATANKTDTLQADGSFTNKPGVVCVVQTADCLPVLFADMQGRAVGAAHAGWRGLVSGVLENTIARMREIGAGDICAWLGPAIGPQKFEVGAEVKEAFVSLDKKHGVAFQAIPEQSGKYLADLYSLARAKLLAAGVRHITGGGFCTASEKERFYSYRRDGVTGRMASLIWLKSA